MEFCKICGSRDLKVIYEGKIRIGQFESLSKEVVQVLQCQSCKVSGLPNLTENIDEYYESDSYREEVDGEAGVEHFFHLHDKEQLRNLSVVGIEAFRGKLVADIGCGGGAFLDAISGYVKSIIAIEPSEAFSDSLSARGYKTYAYTKDAICENEGKIDVAVSFSVLEHVEDPLSFLQEIHALLTCKGKLIISTPNACDILLGALPDYYPRFFYRKAHLWYFSPTALENLLNLAGYKNIQIIPYHRFGLSNFLTWLKDKVPKGDLQSNYVTRVMDSIWKIELERTMSCDYLFAKAVRR